MATSVAIQFAMDTKKIPGPILQEAEERYKKKAREKFKKYMKEKCGGLNNIVLDNLPSINGLPVSAFLSRMCGYTPLIRQSLMPITKILDDEVAKLADNSSAQDLTNLNGQKMASHEKLYAIRTICKLAVDPKDMERMADWLNHHSGSLNEAISIALATECRDLIQELCIGVAFLVRKFHFRMYDKLDLVIAALVRTIAISLIPWETYVEQFRDAKERHNDLELARGRQIIFHYPRMEYQFHEVNHRVLGCVYYTLADLLFSCPSPKLIHFFECRIFRRKEMTRNLLFTILYVIVVNLAEVQSEAELLANQSRQPSSVRVSMDRSMTPLMSRRRKIYTEALWNELPANLYSDIIRVYNDRNRANKILINEIMAILRSHAPDKLPMFEEATLKALEMYTGAGAGRLPETYQIGSKGGGGRDVEGSTVTGAAGAGGQRRRKSGIHTEIQGGSHDTSGRRKSSRVTLIESEQVEKLSEIQSLDIKSSSSSEANYTSDSVGQETRISRRTLIVPKIPDLVQVTRGQRK